MDLDACFSGNWRLTRVVSRVGRPGLFYHKVAFRLLAFTGEDLNSAACWVIRNHLKKITTFHSTLLFLPLSPSFMYSRSISHIWGHNFYCMHHGLRTPREEIAFTARPKIHSHSLFRYRQSIFNLPHRPNFSDIFDLCLHWVSVVREQNCHFEWK